MSKKQTQALKRPRMRFCKYCRGRFRARTSGGVKQAFCCPDHRKQYHKRGALPFEKLKDQLEKSLVLGVKDRFRELFRTVEGEKWTAQWDHNRKLKTEVRELESRLRKLEEKVRKLGIDYLARIGNPL